MERKRASGIGLTKPRAPRPPRSSSRPPTAIELWYLQCLRLLAAHLGRPPSIAELAKYCERAVTPTYKALRSLEAKRVLKQNDELRFVEVKP